MEVHILNGDALRQQIPKSIYGEMIVCRECLVTGPVNGESLEEFWKNREEFLKQAFAGPVEKYRAEVLPEFEKIINLDPEDVINLWFEDDLFCQVNLWFVTNLLPEVRKNRNCHLVRAADLALGFGGMDSTALEHAYQNRTHLDQFMIEGLQALWRSYQNEDVGGLKALARQYENALPFVPAAVQAHIDRIRGDDGFGRPERSLLRIIAELQTHDFGLIFQEFSRREAIYGFGDLQVRNLLNTLNEDR